MISPHHIVSKIRENFLIPQWWRDRVFVPFAVGPLTRLYPGYPGYDEAVQVMDEEWDTLIILDACRADFFEENVDTERFDSYSRVVSLGSHSSEWTRRNFKNKQFEDTVYVSANPHTTLLTDNTFHELVEVWKEYDLPPNQIDPAEIVDIVKQTTERNPHKRLIVHFMQPHGTGKLVTETENRVESYRATIPAVTDLVVELTDQLNGKTVITADHGELFTSGLCAKLGINQHKSRLRVPELVHVPWAEIDGQRRDITDGETSKTNTNKSAAKQRLQDLGYV